MESRHSGATVGHWDHVRVCADPEAAAAGRGGLLPLGVRSRLASKKRAI